MLVDPKMASCSLESFSLLIGDKIILGRSPSTRRIIQFLIFLKYKDEQKRLYKKIIKASRNGRLRRFFGVPRAVVIGFEEKMLLQPCLEGEIVINFIGNCMNLQMEKNNALMLDISVALSPITIFNSILSLGNSSWSPLNLERLRSILQLVSINKLPQALHGGAHERNPPRLLLKIGSKENQVANQLPPKSIDSRHVHWQ